MTTEQTKENPTGRPQESSTAQPVLVGSDEAIAAALEAHPELTERRPSGLSIWEWAQLGLRSAIRTVREIVGQ